jgi:hypothetical protein
MYKHPYLFLLFILITMSGWGQSLELSILTTGGDFATGKSGSLSWTLGEMVIETVSTTDHYLTQGFQQSFHELMTSLEPVTKEINFSIYPNPAKDHVNIDITTGSRFFCYQIEIIDLTGEMVYQSELLCNSFHQRTSIAHFSSSLLLIRITGQSGEILKTWKVIKLYN